jgi:uroporphyrinogen-III decarboxylase
LNNNLEFKCTNDDNESIPEEIKESLNLDFKDVHNDGMKMALLSQGIKKYNKDVICRLPFSNTLEAESLGAKVKFSGNSIQARISDYRINEIGDIYELGEMNFSEGSISEVLEAVKYLSGSGEVVCLQVEGPFTIANQLMDSNLFYKSLIKEKEAMEYLFGLIENGILKYIEMAVARGTSIISYADPSGTIDIVGPKIFRMHSGKLNHDILKKAERYLGNALIHICGRTSCSLEMGGFAKRHGFEAESGMSYGEGLIDIINNHKDIKYIGNGCIKRSNLKIKENVMWGMNLN